MAEARRDVSDVLRWTDAASGRMSDLPHARGGASAAMWQYASQKLLYLFGGCSVVECYEQLERFDLHNGKWAVEVVRGTPPSRRKGATLNLLGRELEDQFLLVLGGWALDGPVPNSMKQYSISHNAWERRAFQGTPPADRWGHTATSIDADHVVVFGGEGSTPGVYLNDVYLFSGDSGEWQHLHPRGYERGGAADRLIPSGRMGHSATVVKTATSHAIYMFGGYTTVNRGMRAHRVATNDLWALDLRGGLQDTAWVKIDTIGRPPAARGHHAAVASLSGGNLFVAFGCDTTEYQCHNDAFMLDTTFPQGHRWSELPVGLQRPSPRHMLTAWAHGASLYIAGGCLPGRDASRDHCFSDQWTLELDGLMQGGKQLNATVELVEEDERLNLMQVPGQRSALLSRTRLGIQGGGPGAAGSQQLGGGSSGDGAAAAGNAGGGGGGETSVVTNGSNALGANAAADAAPRAQNATVSAASVVDDEPPLYIDTSLNQGMDVVSAAVLHRRDESFCHMTNLSRCATTRLTATAKAGDTILEVEDTTLFATGRFLLLAPAEKNEEDVQVRGFGQRVLTTQQTRQLALAKARAAAETAKESVDAKASQEPAAPASSHRSGRLTTAFLQLSARASALLPSSSSGGAEGSDGASKTAADGGGGGSGGSGSGGGSVRSSIWRRLSRSREEPPTPEVHVEAEGAEAGASGFDSTTAARDIPYEASRRVHGRALHRHLNLTQPLRFAHQAGETIIQLPETFTRARAAPGLQHIAGEKLVHRQFTVDDENSPLVILARARRPSPPPSPPLPPPSPPSPPFLPPPRKEIYALEDELYEYDPEDPLGTAKGPKAKVQAAAEAAEAASRGPSWLTDLVAEVRQQAATVGASDFVEHVGTVPVYVWGAVGGAVGLMLILCIVCCFANRAKKKKRQKALEDINPVFQTETWRKLE